MVLPRPWRGGQQEGSEVTPEAVGVFCRGDFHSGCSATPDEGRGEGDEGRGCRAWAVWQAAGIPAGV